MQTRNTGTIDFISLFLIRLELEIDVNAYQQCFRNWERSTLVSID